VAFEARACNKFNTFHTDLFLRNTIKWACTLMHDVIMQVRYGLHISNLTTSIQLTTLILYRLLPSIGTTKSLSATSCNTIKQQLTTDCNTSVINGIYWVQDMQVWMCTPLIIVIVHIVWCLTGLL